MNPKEQKIKESYGEYWETVKDYVDDNGYCNKRDLFQSKKIRYEEIDIQFSHHTDFTMRPIVLENIENNNGWIRIESEADLPKIDFITQYWFFDGVSTWIQTFTLYMKLGRVKITHYQPIIKPEKPLY